MTEALLSKIQELEALLQASTDETAETYEALDKLRTLLGDKLADYDEEKELATLLEWILTEWGSCKTVRRKIDNEGTNYFYESYTDVPVSYDTYAAFADEDGCCYCGNDCYTKKRKK